MKSTTIYESSPDASLNARYLLYFSQLPPRNSTRFAKRLPESMNDKELVSVRAATSVTRLFRRCAPVVSVSLPWSAIVI